MDFLTDLLSQQFLGKDVWVWAIFIGFVGFLLVMDLFVLNRKDHVISFLESMRLSAFYIGLALLFGVWVWIDMGADSAIDYYTAYVVEESLSLDNLFVMSVIFSYFGIPAIYQRRVLVYGILGVIILRGVLLAVGTAAVNEYSWLLYVFAAILIFTGFKLAFSNDEESHDLSNKPLIRFLTKYLPFTKTISGHKLWVREPDATGKMKWFATPLMMALITIEITDVLFAFDSVPAVLAITTDTYIVYTSNIFAILGLRAMFFAVAAILHRFIYMKYALAVILVFIGGKVFLTHLMGPIPPAVSLTITLGTLAAGFLLSIMRTKKGDTHKKH